LEGLTSLENLTIDEYRITDAGLAHLGRLIDLKRLDLSDTDISDAGLVHLEALIEGCAAIDLDGGLSALGYQLSARIRWGHSLRRVQ
jgi:hypothetical protein